MEFRLNEQKKNIHFFSSIPTFIHFSICTTKKNYSFSQVHTIENSTDIVKDNVE